MNFKGGYTMEFYGNAVHFRFPNGTEMQYSVAYDANIGRFQMFLDIDAPSLNIEATRYFALVAESALFGLLTLDDRA